jgi:hypothetical protein
MEMDLALFDPEEGTSIPREDATKYEEPKFEDPQPKPPAEGYMVIM